MKNLKISRKIAICFSVVIILAIIPTVASLFSMQNLANQTLHNQYTITDPLDQMVRFSIAYGNVRSAMRDLGRFTEDAENQRNVATIETNLDLSVRHLRAYYDIFADNIHNQEEYEVVRSVYHAMLEYARIVRTYMIPAGMANQNELVFEILTGELSPIGTIIRLDIEALTEMNYTQGQETVYSAETGLMQSIVLSAVLLLLVIVLVILMAAYISNLITKPLKRLGRFVYEVSKGEYDKELDRSTLTQDEIGDLTYDTYKLIDVIKNISDDLNKFTHEATVNGDIDYQMDEEKYRGGFKELVSGMNGFAKNFTNDMINLMEVLDSIGNGEFNIHLEPLPGKKNIINQKVDALKDNLLGVDNEIGMMIEAAAVKGDMHFHIDEMKYAGGWRKIIKGLNDIAHAVDEPITEIRDAIARFNEGYFDKFVTGDYPGDFESIKNDINELIKGIGEYVHEIGDSLGDISGGDLRRKTTMKFDGEFSRIGDSINTISEKLYQTMSEISAASVQVLSGAKQISVSAMDLATGAGEQASSVEELNASIDIISNQTMQNADNANSANVLSDKSTQNAMDGNDAMKQMLDAMQKIKESSGNISRIIKVIQDIAFQTNLLSLNAAVEAARAGEHGKGFSVVAEEVRNLASRSQQAATETTGLIEESIDNVNQGSSIAETTAGSLDVIVSNASEIMQIIKDISDSSKEQSDAVGQVSLALGRISSVVQSNSASSEETAAAAEELSSKAELLQELVDYFKL